MKVQLTQQPRTKPYSRLILIDPINYIYDSSKTVTGHIATVQKQGSRKGPQEGAGSGKMLVLKNRFQQKNAEDIWSSLILTLSKEEMENLTNKLIESATQERQKTLQSEHCSIKHNMTNIHLVFCFKVKKTLVMSNACKTIANIENNFYFWN